MIHLVKVDLINLFISILCFTEKFPSHSSCFIYLFHGTLHGFFFFIFILKSGVRRSYHRILQGYILAFFTALYVGVWCSAFICSIYFNFPFFKNSFCFVNIYTQATC